MWNNFSSPTLIKCTFTGNSTTGGGTGGGGIYSDNSSPVLVNCSFQGNFSGLWGGGMRNVRGSATLVNCTFLGNSSGFSGGGGIANNLSDARLVNCTLRGNTNFGGGTGGGIQNRNSSDLTVTNSIFWQNSDVTGMVESAQIDDDGTGMLAVNFTLIQGLTGAMGGVGNIGADPLFVDADGPDNIPGTEDDNLRLSPASPCIDAADSTAVPQDVADLDDDNDTTEPTPLDLDGNPRFVDDPATPDTGNGIPPIVDMGAYEFQGAGEPIPTVSQWGVVVMSLLMLTAGKLVYARRRPIHA